jgi:hypothetical protein
MVWGVHCYGDSFASTWTKLGAKASAGARFVQFYPNQFTNFITSWKKGAGFGASVRTAVTSTVRTATQVYLLAHALAKRADWGACPLRSTILGSSPCAKVYFQRYWLDGTEWQDCESGKQNMNTSSFMIVTGDRHLLYHVG